MAALLANGLPLVTEMPSYVMESILKYASGITMLTPELARGFLSRRQHKVCLADRPGRKLLQGSSFRRLPEVIRQVANSIVGNAGLKGLHQTADRLLRYCLSDIEAGIAGDVAKLDGLPLLLCQDLKTTAFTFQPADQGRISARLPVAVMNRFIAAVLLGSMTASRRLPYPLLLAVTTGQIIVCNDHDHFGFAFGSHVCICHCEAVVCPEVVARRFIMADANSIVTTYFLKYCNRAFRDFRIHEGLHFLR